MIKTLNINLLQYDISWENPAKNFQQIQALESYFSDSDIIFLPEMFSTGFSMNVEKIAEKTFGESFQFLQKLAKKHHALVVGSIPVEEKGSFYNRMYWVEPNETFQIYDKRHLFSFAGEDKFYSAGKSRKIFSYQNWSFLPQICYDLRFPVFARNKNDYEVLFYIANWPKSRINAWNQLLKARAIENQCFVVGVNRTGIDGNGIAYNGKSQVINPLGEKIEPLQPHECVLQFSLDFLSLKKIREKFPFLKDADEFHLKF
ncbi:amidohydrolase [Candidatus Ornithobacterium hominis]|uniref:amidohydrolase n=1 Tax=Candidatus Ornithobacterium hominis TaxID=2497989 RepID=UPI0024BC264E|nr:amidohydrolase [Candidatus Ornithobacterium hominis]CAI9429520.1 amidohydrolase [Candidatus Ornithobacterium hominis]